MIKKESWVELALLPFVLCVLFLMGLSKILGLTYKEISVTFNLWLQGVVLMFSGLAPAAMVWWKIANDGSWQWGGWAIVMTTYGAAYIYGFVMMLQHYHLPFDFAFDICVRDLQQLAKRCNTTYQVVNLVIFVVLFIILAGLNIIMANVIYQL